MTERSTVDRAPVQLTNIPLSASVTTYYPSSDGQDRLGSTGLWSYVRAQGWSDEAGTLTLEVSDNRSSWATLGSALTFTADVINTFKWIELTKRYWRWKFVNGGTDQTIFKLFEDKAPDVNGVVTGSDVTAGSGTLSASFEADGSGYGVLRVLDAAPWGYNQTLDATRTVGAAKAGTVTVASHNATASSTTALASSATRVFCKIQNVSDTNVTLNLAGGTAVALVGVVLLPFGIWEAKLGDWDFTTGAITCIHAGTGNKALAVTSGVA